MSSSDTERSPVETGLMWVGVLLGLSGLESGWALGWLEAGLLSTIGFGLALGALFSRRQPGRVSE